LDSDFCIIRSPVILIAAGLPNARITEATGLSDQSLWIFKQSMRNCQIMIEQLWKHVKSRLRSKYYNRFDDYKNTIDSFIGDTSRGSKNVIDN